MPAKQSPRGQGPEPGLIDERPKDQKTKTKGPEVKICKSSGNAETSEKVRKKKKKKWVKEKRERRNSNFGIPATGINTTNRAGKELKGFL